MNDDTPALESEPRIPLVWQRDDPGELSDANSAVVDEIARLIKLKERKSVTSALRRWPPPHLLELFVHLPLKRARTLFRWLDDQPRARLIAELNPAYRATLLEDSTVSRLVEILDTMEPEEAADALDDLPDEVAEQVRPRLAAHEAIESQRRWGEESAGSISSCPWPAMPASRPRRSPSRASPAAP